MQDLRNDLERRLGAVHAGRLDPDVVEGERHGVQVFVAVEDGRHRIAHFSNTEPGLDLEPETVTPLAPLAAGDRAH